MLSENIRDKDLQRMRFVSFGGDEAYVRRA
jgi:hypothetical protein